MGESGSAQSWRQPYRTVLLAHGEWQGKVAPRLSRPFQALEFDLFALEWKIKYSSSLGF